MNVPQKFALSGYTWWHVFGAGTRPCVLRLLRIPNPNVPTNGGGGYHRTRQLSQLSSDRRGAKPEEVDTVDMNEFMRHMCTLMRSENNEPWGGDIRAAAGIPMPVEGGGPGFDIMKASQEAQAQGLIERKDGPRRRIIFVLTEAGRRWCSDQG